MGGSFSRSQSSTISLCVSIWINWWRLTTRKTKSLSAHICRIYSTPFKSLAFTILKPRWWRKILSTWITTLIMKSGNKFTIRLQSQMRVVTHLWKLKAREVVCFVKQAPCKVQRPNSKRKTNKSKTVTTICWAKLRAQHTFLTFRRQRTREGCTPVSTRKRLLGCLATASNSTAAICSKISQTQTLAKCTSPFTSSLRRCFKNLQRDTSRFPSTTLFKRSSFQSSLNPSPTLTIRTGLLQMLRSNNHSVNQQMIH